MKLRIVLNWVALLATLVINGLATGLPLGGRTTGEISDSFPVLFTPAGYVFTIWGVIYLALIGFAIFQSLPAQRNNPRLERIGYWFLASCIFNSVWIFLWQYELFPFTILAMLGLLVSLIAIYQRVGIGLQRVPRSETWLVNVPFGIYLGWVSVATIANTAVLLYSLGWNGWILPPAIWTLIVLLVATGLGITLMFTRREVAYPLVLVWAFAGIYNKQAATPLVAVTAAVLAVLLVILLVVSLVRRKQSAVQAQVSPSKLRRSPNVPA
jgi:translocator protein